MKDSLLPYPKREQPVFLHWMFYRMTVSSFLDLLFLLALFYCMFPVEELILTKASREK